MEDVTDRELEQLHAMLRSHVEACLSELWGSDCLDLDADGDYGYRWGTAACWVRPSVGGALGVRVFAHAVHSVKRSAKLLAELNELNQRSRHCQVFLGHDAVVVAANLDWDLVAADTLDRVMRSVGMVADDIGVLVATVFGGQTPFPAGEDEPARDADAGDEAA